MKTISFIDMSGQRYCIESNGAGLDLTAAEDVRLSHGLDSMPTVLGTGIILHPDSYDDVGAMQLQLHPRLSIKGICSLSGAQFFDPKFAGSAAHKYDDGLFLHVKDLTCTPTIIEANKPVATLMLYNAQGMLMLPDVHYAYDFDNYDFSNASMKKLCQWARCYGGYVDDTFAS